MRSNEIIAILGLSILFSSCKNPSDYSLTSRINIRKEPIDWVCVEEENELRRKLGLSLIGNSWVKTHDKNHERHGTTMEYWRPSVNSKYSKILVKGKNGELLEEYDYFYTGEKYINEIDGESVSEGVAMQYYYAYDTFYIYLHTIDLEIENLIPSYSTLTTSGYRLTLNGPSDYENNRVQVKEVIKILDYWGFLDEIFDSSIKE